MNDFLKEKELLLDSIENNTPEHWKNYYKDVPIECIYDDLVIDINEIKRLQQENQQLKEKIEYLKQKSENKDRWCQLMADIGYDYDGYRKAEHLMKLIDELVTYALYCRDGYDYLEWKKEGSDSNE